MKMTKVTHIILAAGFALSALAGRLAWAEEESWSDKNNSETEVEELYDKNDGEEKKVENKAVDQHKDKPAPEVPAKTLADLVSESEFQDVAVIQKRFLPKSNRWELTGSGITNLNNPFFNNLGVNGGLTYYLRERWGVEGIFNWVATSKRKVVKDLETQGIDTANLVTTKYFYGAAVKWNPIYGKMTWLNKRIVPFDLNFSGGLGLTKTNEGGSEMTVHMASSQVFAMTKAMAVRWDICWNFFNATTTTASGRQDKVFQSDIYLGLGMSFYFPEATYR
jgi:outer membrane beta-barrel protein